VILPPLPFAGRAQEKRTIEATEEHPEMALVPIFENVWVYQRIDEGSKEAPKGGLYLLGDTPGHFHVTYLHNSQLACSLCGHLDLEE